MTGNKRIAYLDMARGIGMILVVIGHVEYINVSVRQFISAFHMPLFFLISGILIWEKQDEAKNFIELMKRKLRHIMLPYAIFSLLSLVIESARLVIRGLDDWDLIMEQLRLSLCLQGFSTLWFLPALFMSELLFVGLRKLFNNKGTIGSVLAIVLITVFFNGYIQNISSIVLCDVLLMLVRNLFCVGFVGIGYYTAKLLIPMLEKGWQEGLVTLPLLLLTCMAIPLNWGVDLRNMNLRNAPLFMVGAIGGSLLVLLVCKLLTRSSTRIITSPLEYYGRNSLIIMVTHLEFRVLYCSIVLSEFLYKIWNNQLIFCALIVVLVFVIEIPIIWLTNRFLPFILGKNIKNS